MKDNMHYDEGEARYLQAVGHQDEATSIFFRPSA